MAGGQAVTSGQGSVTPDRSLTPSGAVLTGEQGFVSTAVQELVGAQSSASAGSSASAAFVGLRSRKVGGGTAFRALTGIEIAPSNGTITPNRSRTPSGAPIAVSAGSAAPGRSKTLTGQAITPAAGTLIATNDPSWPLAVPTITFTLGVSGSHNLAQYTANFDSAVYEIVLASGSPALPTGVTLSAAGVLSYNGSGIATSVSGYTFEIRNKVYTASMIGAAITAFPGIVTGNSLDAALLADWQARGTEGTNGVTFACDFSGASDFVTAATNGGHVFAGGMSPAILARVVKDTSDGLTNGCCLRIDTPADAGANTAAWMFPFARNYTSNASNIGNEFYIQFRFKIPASRLSLSNCGGLQRGWKWMNIAQYSITDTDSQSFSNTQAEHVLQDTNQRGFPQAYHNPGFEPFQGFAGGQITLQTAIDRGLPNTGGDRYCHYPDGTAACEDFVTDEWVTFMVRIKVATYSGSTGNEFDLWYARRYATSWTQLFNDRNYAIGSPNSSGGGFTHINGGHFLTYETNRVATATGNVATHHKYDQVIVSTQPIALPAAI